MRVSTYISELWKSFCRVLEEQPINTIIVTLTVTSSLAVIAVTISILIQWYQVGPLAISKKVLYGQAAIFWLTVGLLVFFKRDTWRKTTLLDRLATLGFIVLMIFGLSMAGVVIGIGSALPLALMSGTAAFAAFYVFYDRLKHRSKP